MADRRVTHAVRDGRGNIRALCNPGEAWRQRRKEWAILDILERRHDYFVTGTGGARRRIYVVNGPTGPYLRTVPDQLEGNNLDTLPSCHENPWEIALADAEILAVHAALLPIGAGQVLMMGGDEQDPDNAKPPGEARDRDEDSPPFANTRIYDVATNTVSDPGSPNSDVFCCGHAWLGDGRLLVAGGTAEWNDRPPPEDSDAEPSPESIADAHFGLDHWSGARECSVFDPATKQWQDAALLLPEPGSDTRGGGRWYPTVITLADGRALAVGGHPFVDSLDGALTDNRHGAWLPEIYNPAADGWTYQPGRWLYVDWGVVPQDEPLPEGQIDTGERNYPYYPRMFTLPDGRVFLGSPNEQINGIYDPATGLVEDTGVTPPPNNGRWHSELNHTVVMLPIMPGDGHTPHFIMMNYDGANRISFETGEDAAEPVWERAGSPDRDWPPGAAPLRRHGYGILLPTGEVLFTGGLDHDEGAEGPVTPDSAAIKIAEVYDPGIDFDAAKLDFAAERWTNSEEAEIVRNYHSVALLLPNGRVLSAGSNKNGGPGGDAVKEMNIEIYLPWYDGSHLRPVIHSAPPSIGYGETFDIISPDTDRIALVALMRCGTATHAWDGDQRFVGLEFTIAAQGVLRATAPSGGGIAPPGPYMLWLIDRQRRPCRQAAFVALA